MWYLLSIRNSPSYCSINANTNLQNRHTRRRRWLRDRGLDWMAVNFSSSPKPWANTSKYIKNRGVLMEDSRKTRVRRHVITTRLCFLCRTHTAGVNHGGSRAFLHSCFSLGFGHWGIMLALNQRIQCPKGLTVWDSLFGTHCLGLTDFGTH